MLRYSSTIPPAIQHHDLDGVELALASLDVLQQLAGVVQTVGDTDVELQAVTIDGSATYTFQTTEFLEVDCCENLTKARLYRILQGRDLRFVRRGHEKHEVWWHT